MKGLVQTLLFGLAMFLGTSPKQTQASPSSAPPLSASLLHEQQLRLLHIIRHDVFTPPVATRIFTYANIAFYETIRREDPTYPTLVGKLNGLDSFPVFSAKMALANEIVAYVAFWTTARLFLSSEDSADYALDQLYARFSTTYDENVLQVSMAMGKRVAEFMQRWADGDHFNYTRTLKRYQPLKGEGYWQPTPPDYADALEPHWGKIRPLTLTSAAQCRAPAPPQVDWQPESMFMREVREVYEVTRQLDSVQRLIALYWDDNPFTTIHAGHITYSIKKFSPGAHWMLIAQQALKNVEANLIHSAWTYTLTALAVFDGFISCWYEKYLHHVVRPVTVVNRIIDPSWKPLIQTPPFPEYTSGHSVVSAAAATVLTQLFGDSFAFIDSTEMLFGLPARRFASFLQAAEEASLSRLYGGIHFRSGLLEGQRQGRAVGRQVLYRMGLL